MRLNLQTDYALRLLSKLAALSDEPATITAISERYGISKNHMMKVASALTRAGVVESVRGRHGGLRLARPADAIRIGDVVRLMENDFALVECFGTDEGRCLITSACRLKGVLGEALAAFLSVLDRYTLEDLTRRNAPLSALLS